MYLQKAGGMRIHIYLLYKCKKVLFEFIGKLTPHITQITSLFSEIACRILEPIKVYYNFIEVCDGFRFDIEGKKFIRNSKRLKGSPRVSVRYTYHEDKTPKPFIDDMENIFF